MDVHVGEAGDQEFARGVDYAGARRDFEGGVGADRRNFFAINQNCGVWFGRSARSVNDGRVGDRDCGGVGFGAGNEEKENRKRERHARKGNEHSCIVTKRGKRTEKKKSRKSSRSILRPPLRKRREGWGTL